MTGEWRFTPTILAHSVTVLIVTLVTFACSGGRDSPDGDIPPNGFTVTSPVFSEGDAIPVKYTCDGEDVSPPIRWSGVPKGTKSISIIADDPGAPRGTWIHWVARGIPPNTTSVTEGLPAEEHLANGGEQGKNDFKRFGYKGPCPPKGTPHEYIFRVYALNTDELDLYSGATAWDLRKEMGGHVLASGNVLAIGTLAAKYQRR